MKIQKWKAEQNWGAIKTWLDTLENKGHLDNLQQRLGPLDPLAVISKMSRMEQQVLVSLVSASNRLGHDQCREQRREWRITAGNKNPGAWEKRANFKVIEGGAA